MQSSKLRLELVETYVLRGHASLVPPLQKDPGGHASQSSWLCSPDCIEKVPASHVFSMADAAGQYVPGPHSCGSACSEEQ